MKTIKIQGKISSFAVGDSFSSRYLVKGEPFEDSLISYYNSENTSVNNFVLIPSLQDTTYTFTMNSFKFKDNQTTYSAKGYSLLKD